MIRLLCIFVLLGVASDAFAQIRGRIPPNQRDPVLLSEADGARMLAGFRSAYLPGQYAMQFRLTRRGDNGLNQTRDGILWGHWPREGAAWRIVMPDAQTGEHFLLRGQAPTGAWRWDAETSGWQDLAGPWGDGQALVADWGLRPFDLLMPFTRWANTAYEGSLRVRGRPAHAFLFFPPEEDPRYADVAAVRVTLDEDFLALLEADIIGQEGNVLRTLRMTSFKKVEEQWLVRRLEIVDRTSGERLRWDLEAVDLDVALPESGFSILDAKPETPTADWVRL